MQVQKEGGRGGKDCVVAVAGVDNQQRKGILQLIGLAEGICKQTGNLIDDSCSASGPRGEAGSQVVSALPVFSASRRRGESSRAT